MTMATNSSIAKIIGAMIVPVVGFPLYGVAYTKVNESLAGTDNAWGITLFSVVFILALVLTPLGLLYSVLKQ